MNLTLNFCWKFLEGISLRPFHDTQIVFVSKALNEPVVYHVN